MTKEEFETQINRLSGVYPQAYKSTERVVQFYKALASTPGPLFKLAIDEAIKESRQAPMLSDLLDFISRAKESSYEKQKRVDSGPSPAGWDLNRNYSCEFCKDTGTFLCISSRKPDSGFWAFRCHCRKGEADLRTQIPHYKAVHRDEGYIFFEPSREMRDRILNQVVEHPASASLAASKSRVDEGLWGEEGVI